MKNHDSETSFLKKVKHSLDQGEENIPAETLSRLNRIRQEALKIKKKEIAWAVKWIPMPYPALATATVVLLAVLLSFPATRSRPHSTLLMTWKSLLPIINFNVMTSWIFTPGLPRKNQMLVKLYLMGTVFMLTILSTPAQAQQAESTQTSKRQQEPGPEIPSLEFLEFLGEWETEDGSWIDP
ncbi:MAG: DUF3619 family protein, partial [Nitrospinae bacterium]|nr:DUF3619 family protein [Nitrospinota bacterium]